MSDEFSNRDFLGSLGLVSKPRPSVCIDTFAPEYSTFNGDNKSVAHFFLPKSPKNLNHYKKALISERLLYTELDTKLAD